jgi:hypothetical protein
MIGIEYGPFQVHNIVFATGGTQNCKKSSTLQGHKSESGISIFLKERKKKVSPRSRQLLFPETAHLFPGL